MSKITGKTLIELGYKPGSWFGDAISYANDNNLTGVALLLFLAEAQPIELPTLELHNPSIEYHKNIRAEHEEEVSNLMNVFQTMNELMKTPTIVDGAIMPDACPTGSIGNIPVGGIAVAKNAIHPSMHSADICCSVMMTNFGKVNPKTILDSALSITHFGPGGRGDLFPLPTTLLEQMKANDYLKDDKSKLLATTHLGTQGDGNHFLFIGRSENTGDVIMVTHHGSRGLGAYLYKKGMKVAEKYRKLLSPNTMTKNAWIPFDTEDGASYWEALQIVREWTKQNHLSIHDRTIAATNSNVNERFWNEHNFIFKDDDLFYHAKGATPLADKFVPDSYNGLRLIPLNMSEPVLIVKGVETNTNLGFAPHGAGRNISRTAHKNKHSSRSIDSIFEEETAGLDVRFYSNNIDISELPSAYKNATSVMEQMKEFGLGEVVDKIIPYGCIMAGNNNFERRS